MTEDGSGTTGEDSRHAGTVARQCGVTDRVDATMDAMQSTRRVEAPDGATREAKLQKLCVRYDSILSARAVRQLGVRTHFFPHTGIKCAGVPDSPHGNICSPA